MKLMYQGSEAYRLDAPGEGALAQNSAPSFEVFEGRGLDAQARRGVSSQLVTRLRVLAAVVCALALLGIARVGIYSAAVSVLADNTSIRSDIKDARSTQGDLRVERSVLSSSTRIGRIATQSYGMVAADDPEQMVAGSTEAPAADGSGAESSSDSDATPGDVAASSDASAGTDTSARAAASLGNVAQTDGDGSTAGSNAVTMDSIG